jgi:hypothetical protein
MKNEPITAARLRALLNYEPLTGIFTWRVSVGPAKAGAVAGTRVARKGTSPCISISIAKRHYMAHRLAWLCVYGTMPDSDIDHKDGDGLNNTIDNLRSATKAQNMANRGRQANSTTGFKGVYNMTNGKYRAKIVHSKHQIYLGAYPTKEEAAAAYRAAAQALYGEFAKW